MRRLQCALLAAVAAVGFASIASAADMPMKARPMAPAVYDWTGCYIGGQVGYAWARDQNSETVTATGAASIFSPVNSATPSGGKLGGMLGCNWQVAGAWVVGLEGDFEWAGINGGSVVYANTVNDRYETKIRSEGSVRGRVGYAFDRFLAYATGGLAFANIQNVYTPTGGTPVETFSKTRSGWTLGAGLEYAFAPKWTARVEYRYADFGRNTDLPVTTYAGFTESHRLTESAVRLGIAYKF